MPDRCARYGLPLRPVTAMHCQACRVRAHCFPLNLGSRELAALEAIIQRSRPLQRGEHLYRADDPQASLYAVRSGTLKTYLLSSDGNEQITGFHLPGELLGLDALGRHSHPGFAVALETSMLCSIPLTRLETLAGSLPQLRGELLRVMSEEIQADQRRLGLLRCTGEERLAGFLLDLAGRFGRRGLSARHFILPMSRCEIANYLGLTSETVSRLLARYKRNGLLDIDGREVRLKHLGLLSPLQLKDIPQG